jgi:Flp pilus assembly pilin Flp
MNPVYGPAITYLRVALAARYARLRDEDSERGASAVEWVVISAIVVVIILAVGIWLTSALETKAQQVCTSIDGSGAGTNGANCTGTK